MGLWIDIKEIFDDLAVDEIFLNDTLNIGNVVQNANTMSASTQFNLLNLYNKVKYLKDVNNKYRGRASPKKKETETVTYEENINKLAAGKKKVTVKNVLGGEHKYFVRLEFVEEVI